MYHKTSDFAQNGTHIQILNNYSLWKFLYRKNVGTKLRYRQKANHSSLRWETIMTKHYRLFHDAAISVILIADNGFAKLA